MIHQYIPYKVNVKQLVCERVSSQYFSSRFLIVMFTTYLELNIALLQLVRMSLEFDIWQTVRCWGRFEIRIEQ